MKRRTFVKKSVAASILTPLALTGLINAAGATETGGGGETGGTTEAYTTVPETWFTSEPEGTDYDVLGCDPRVVVSCYEAIHPRHRQLGVGWWCGGAFLMPGGFELPCWIMCLGENGGPISLPGGDNCMDEPPEPWFGTT